MRINLENKLVVVTGSTAGIGFAIGTGLAAAGANVVLNGRTQARVNEAITRLQSDSSTFPSGRKPSTRGVAADLSTREGASAFIAQVPDADILANNLGVFEPKPFFEIPDDSVVRSVF